MEVVNVVGSSNSEIERYLDDTYSSYYSSDDNDNGGSKTCYMNDLNIAKEKCSQSRKKYINTSHSEALIILQTSKLKVSDFFKK